MNLHKQLDYNKGLFMYRVLNSEAPEYISNLYTHIPSRYSNSWKYQLSLPRPRIDIFKTGLDFHGALISIEQHNSNSQIVSLVQLLEEKTSCKF